jgi:glucose-6-phosphate isomerase
MTRKNVQHVNEDPAVTIDSAITALDGRTGRYTKVISELDGLYRDSAEYAAWRASAGDDAEAYYVDEFRPSAAEGDLIYGLSVLHPGTVGREYVMTRGHLHAKSDRAEMYHCLRGHGLMLMETVEGDTHVVELRPGQIAYVPPHYIHRSINVGDDDFVTLFCYPADSGQNYGIIADSNGMRHIAVVDGESGWTLEENPDYVIRD